MDEPATTVQAATTVGAAVPAEPYEDEPEEKKSRTWLFIALLVAMLALLAGALFWFSQSLDDGDLVTMPPVVGLPFEEARATLVDLGLEVEIDRQPSAQFEEGRVTDQDPAKDEEVEKGSTVTLVVSSGPDVAVVPNVLLQTQDEAIRMLEEVGLVAKVTPREVADAEPGFVVEQDPVEGEEVAPGSTVEIFVSTEVGTVIVPDVIGTPLAQAQAQIQAAGLRFADATETPSASVPAGAVISTDPGSGASVPTNSIVQIVVSSGPEQVDVPNLVGRTEGDATAELRNRGLEADVTPQTVPAGDPNVGRVISQDPAGGATVDLGSTVRITVGVAGAATTTTTTSSSTTTTSQP